MTTPKTTPKTTSKAKRKTERDTPKPHRTVSITKEFLERHGACRRGMAFIDALLPVELSTDPDDNVDLAVHLATTDYSLLHNGIDGLIDTRWLATVVDALRISESMPAGTEDGYAFIIQQLLAMIADAILSKQGL